MELCLEQLSIVKSLVGGFELDAVQSMQVTELMQWFTRGLNLLLQTDEITENYLREERKLSELMAMTNSDERIWEIQEDVAIVQKFRERIRQIKYPPGAQRTKNNRIKDLISRSLESQAIVDLAAMYNLDKIDISIVDDSFQAIVKDKGGENIKIELLRRIINDELKVRMSKNIKKGRKLKDELEKVLGKYHKNSLDSIAAIKHLLDIANEMKADDKRTKELGLTEDELALYDLLPANSAISYEAGPVHDLVHTVLTSV